MAGDFDLLRGEQSWRCKDCGVVVHWEHGQGMTPADVLQGHRRSCRPRPTFTLSDLLWWDASERVQFPRIGHCATCRGVAAVAAQVPNRHGVIINPTLAYQAFLVRHGHWLARIDGHLDVDRHNFSTPCDCVTPGEPFVWT